MHDNGKNTVLSAIQYHFTTRLVVTKLLITSPVTYWSLVNVYSTQFLYKWYQGDTFIWRDCDPLTIMHRLCVRLYVVDSPIVLVFWYKWLHHIDTRCYSCLEYLNAWTLLEYLLVQYTACSFMEQYTKRYSRQHSWLIQNSHRIG